GEDWASYTEDRMPNNVTNVATPDENTVVLTLDQAYNQKWFTSTQLIYVTALPQHAWARTSDDGKIIDQLNDDDARDVFDYLVTEAKDISTYSTNPLWQVVSGPMQVEEYETDGHVKLVANDAYDGSDPAQADVVNLMPFTSSGAE